MPPHNIKGKKENTLANMCNGSHRLMTKPAPETINAILKQTS